MWYKNNFCSLCLFPIGALTSKPYAFSYRPWELKNYESFDPTSEFYQPIWLSIVNNKIQKVLPVNDNSNVFLAYNWISNKLRFFFESFDFQANQFFPKYLIFFKNLNSLISVRWSYLLKRMTQKLVNLQKFSYVSLNFLQTQKFDSNVYFEVNRTLFEIPNFIKISGYNNFTKNIFKSQLTNFYNFFPLGKYPTTITQPSNILLISFNPYFLDPSFSYYLKSINEISSVKIYTTFFSYFFTNFKVRNLIPNIKNLWLLFSGRHPFSKQLLKKGSKIIIDSNFLSSLPNALISLILKSPFFNKQHHIAQPALIYVVQNNKFYSNFLKTGLNSFIPYKNFLVNSNYRVLGLDFGFNNHDTTHLFNNLVNKEFISNLEVNDYHYIFKFEIAKFLQFSETFYDFSPTYFFPTSGFTEFTANYEIFANRSNHFKNAVSVYREHGRPLAQILNSIRFWFFRATKYANFNITSYSVWITIFIYFLFNFAYFTNQNLALLNFWFHYFNQLNKNSCVYYLNIRIFKSSVTSYNWGGLQNNNSSSYFSKNTVVFSSMGLGYKFCSPYIKLQSLYFCPSYVDSCMESINNLTIVYSRTLTIQRKFFNSRFKNFNEVFILF